MFSLVFANTKSPETARSVLEYMTLTYAHVEYMKSTFSKKSTSTLLGNTEKTSGELEYAKGKFRLEMKEKIRNIFIKGEKSFWHISDKTVLKGDASKAVPTVFEAIFSDPKIWSAMKTEFIKKGKRFVEIKVDTNDKVPNIKEMKLKIDNIKKTLINISYTDDVNNSVEINFKNTRFFKNAKTNRFTYNVKETDEVSQM